MIYDLFEKLGIREDESRVETWSFRVLALEQGYVVEIHAKGQEPELVAADDPYKVVEGILGDRMVQKLNETGCKVEIKVQPLHPPPAEPASNPAEDKLVEELKIEHFKRENEFHEKVDKIFEAEEDE